MNSEFTIAACVRIEDFGLPAGTVPVALIDYRQRRAKVAATSASARSAGVQPGMSLTRARALCPKLTPEPFKPEKTETLRDRVLNTLWIYTNRIELDADALPQTGIFLLDLGRTRDEDALKIGAQIHRAVSNMGLSVSVGMARGKFTAHAAVQGGVTLIRRDEEAAFLAPLPVSLLPLKRDHARLLDLIGIHTLGQFAALTRSQVSTRFGKPGRLWYLLASGMDTRPVVPHKMPEFESTHIDFEDAVTDSLILDNALSRMASVLAQRLDARSSSAHNVALTVYLERGATLVRRTQRVKAFTECTDLRRALFALLDESNVAEPVSGLGVKLSHLVATIPRQMELFTTRTRKQEVLDFFAALAERFGDHSYAVEVNNYSLLEERNFRLISLRKEGVS